MDSGKTAVVAGDFRLSTPALKAAVIDGLASAGIRVLDAGQIPTPVAYFWKRTTRANALLMVTASHNPASDNGLKFMIGAMPPSERDLYEIRELTESRGFRRAAGAVEISDPVPAYRDWILSRWRHLNAREFGPVVLDPGNGAWSRLAPDVFRELGFDTHCLHCEPDGRFPGRPPDCARTANLLALRAAVVRRGAALGIAWDGDGDRVAFVDASGRHVPTDEISILLARHALRDSNAEDPVVCDIKLSDVVRRTVLGAGGRPMLERSGHAFMRGRMIAESALLGLDACGHYFFRELEFGDDGLFAALFMIGLLQSSGTLAALCETTGPLFSTPELRIPASLMNYEMARAHLRAEFPGALESNVDGTRMETEGGVLLARESSTEPVVSLRIEGFSQSAYENLLARTLRALHPAESLLRGQMEDAAR